MTNDSNRPKNPLDDHDAESVAMRAKQAQEWHRDRLDKVRRSIEQEKRIASQRLKRRWSAILIVSFICIGTGVTGGVRVFNKIVELLTPYGTFTLEISDPDVVLEIDGEQVEDFGEMRLSPGLHHFSATKDGNKVIEGEIVLRKGDDNDPISIGWLSGRLGIETVSISWLKELSTQPPNVQVESVAGKFVELNPGFDGNVESRIEKGEVKRINFVADRISDISPLIALKGLQELRCKGTWLADIRPLQVLPNLQLLNLGETSVHDLTPLRKLRQLKRLYISQAPIHDLSPLENLSLEVLHCGGTGVTDLSPLRRSKLRQLRIWRTAISDLSPLAGMPQEQLYFNETHVTDFSPIKGMPLKEIWCDYDERHRELLKSISSLEKINGQPADKFWDQN